MDRVTIIPDMARTKTIDPWEQEWRRRYAEAQAHGPVHRPCEHPGCTERGEFRAPRARDKLNEYRWFCLDHVRAYNAAWNYFAGMSEPEVEAHIRRDITWDRPTWRLGDGQRAKEPKRGWKVYDDFGIYEENVGPDAEQAEKAKRQARQPAASPEAKAAAELGLELPVTWQEVRVRYRQLVKENHPDAHGGNKAAEERLKSINHAYSILRKFLC